MNTEQLTLTLEAGIATRHRSLRECMAAGVYQRGLARTAAEIDMQPSKLCEKLSGGSGDRVRDVGVGDLERYIEATGDLGPVHYLVDKYLREPAAMQAASMAHLQQQMQALAAAMQSVGVSMPARGRGAALMSGADAVDPVFEPDVWAYITASALQAEHAAPRCGTGFATCSHAHLGIGPACEAGVCRVREHDAQVSSGLEVCAHG